MVHCARAGCKSEAGLKWPLMKCYHPKAKEPTQVAPDLAHCQVHQIMKECKTDLHDMAYSIMKDAGLARPTEITITWTDAWVLAGKKAKKVRFP